MPWKMSFDDTGCTIDGLNLSLAMMRNNNQRGEKQQGTSKPTKRSIAEKMAVAEQLRDLQRALAPMRAANRAKRAAGKVEIRIKTR